MFCRTRSPFNTDIDTDTLLKSSNKRATLYYKTETTRKLHDLSNRSYLDRLHALGLETLEHRSLIHDLIHCYKYLHRLIDTDNRNFSCVQLLPRTRNNGLKLYKPTVILMQKRRFYKSQIALLTFGTLYPQQSFLVIMCIFLKAV